MMDRIQQRILAEVADLHEVRMEVALEKFFGAYVHQVAGDFFPHDRFCPNFQHIGSIAHSAQECNFFGGCYSFGKES